ncbi:HD domain-containing protein [Marinobacterium sp. AK62]|uniref:HD domain-containing protein n=1 Tax=Marinobacterium alkalitolerans TaxID=1542925 RepID=A0ABS3Z8E8_9GAMM|nr:HD domain-containing phosphohydrolase [Marinobacterium alkalitolerans]MBP0047996.1 HD domain-containing protein [Marinobacterium alkalitolerans]
MDPVTAQRTLTGLELKVGTRLPWSLYSPQGALLLTEGTLIRSERQIESLISANAYYVHTPSLGTYKTQEHQRSSSPKVSSFVIIHTLLERLEACFSLAHRSGQSGAFVRGIMKLVFDIQAVCEENPDAILGTMQLIVEAPHGLLHPLHAALMCEVAACRMGYDALERAPLVAAALTHDIGMYDIQQALFEQRAPLSASQREIVDNHPLLSYELLQSHGVNEPRWLNPVLQHHERLDGSGYPNGLKADSICREARLLAITDCYSAMIRPRAYREQVLPKDAIKEIFQQRGATIDERLARLFIDVMGVFVPGTLVELSHGELALVTGQGEGLNQPAVALLQNRLGVRLEAPRHLVLEDSQAIRSILRLQDHTDLIALLGRAWPEMSPIPSAV